MADRNLVETDATGHFRLVNHHDKKNRKKVWLSPRLKEILHQSGRDFEVFDLDDEVDPSEELATSGHPVCCRLDDPDEPYPALNDSPLN